MIEKSYRHESNLNVFSLSIRHIYDLLGSPRDLNLRSYFDLDLSRSPCTSFDAS